MARDEWEQEIAMQAGMGLGIDAYNEALGYDTMSEGDLQDAYDLWRDLRHEGEVTVSFDEWLRGAK